MAGWSAQEEQSAHWLREKILKSSQDGSEVPKYDPRDITRVQNNLPFLCRFARHYRNEHEAQQRLEKTLIWRKNIGLNDLTSGSFPSNFFGEGMCYSHGTDLKKRPIVIFHVSQCPAELDDVAKQQGEQWMAHVLEQEAEKTLSKGIQITLVIDARRSSPEQTESQCVVTLLEMIDQYFPSLIGSIIVVQEMETKMLLRKCAEHLSKETYATTVCQVPPGGLSKYISSKELSPAFNESKPSRVSFALPDSHDENKSRSSLSQSKPPRNSRKAQLFAKYARLNPAKDLLFSRIKSELQSKLAIANNHHGPIAFKIKTTSPNFYRVRPNSGILQPKPNSPNLTSERLIEIFRVACAEEELKSKDRFLVMLAPCPTTLREFDDELNEFWKNVDKSKTAENKLYCKLALPEPQEEASVLSKEHNEEHTKRLSAIEDVLRQVHDNTVTIKERSHFATFILVGVFFFLLGILLEEAFALSPLSRLSSLYSHRSEVIATVRDGIVVLYDQTTMLLDDVFS